MQNEGPEAKIPKQKRSEKTRQKIIDAGLRLFSEHGYHATSSKKIAREAGVAIGSFYNYFTDKKQLLFELHRIHSERVHGMIARSIEESNILDPRTDSRSLIQAIVEQTWSLHDFSPALQREITALAYTNDEFAQMQRAEQGRDMAVLTEIFRKRKNTLRVNDLEAAGILIGQTMEAVMHSLWIFGSAIDHKRMLDALADMLHRYLFKDTKK